jgi:hypothetical protein
MRIKFGIRNIERGQVLPILVIGILIIIAMAALLIDGGMLLSHRRDAQAAADAGALAGAAYLCPNNYDSGKAIMVADQYALDNIENVNSISSGSSSSSIVSTNTIRVETSVTSSSFFARIFDLIGLNAGAEAEANCSPAAMVRGALPIVYPCDPVVDDANNQSEYGNCKVIYGDPEYGDTREENVQYNLDNDLMTILLSSDSVTVDCYDEVDNPTGTIECGDNVKAMGDRGWIYLDKDGKPQDIVKWIAGDEENPTVIGIGYWLSTQTGVNANLYQNHIANIRWQDRYVPIYNKECGMTYPSTKCPTLFESGDNEEEIRSPGAKGQTNYRIAGFALFRITCVFPNKYKDGTECLYRNKLVTQGVIPNNSSILSVEGYFISGKTPDGGGGGPDYKLYTVQLSK